MSFTSSLPSGPAVLSKMRQNGWYPSSDGTHNGSDQTKDELASSDAASSSSRGEDSVSPVEKGDGWRMWQKVVDATGSVASAVKSRLNNEDELYESDEEGYTGGDSHLIRVMKEYYVERASHPTDVPEWLFPDRRRDLTRAWASEPSSAPAASHLPHSRSISTSAHRPSRSQPSDHLKQQHRQYASQTADAPRAGEKSGKSGYGNVSELGRVNTPLKDSVHGSRTAQKLRSRPRRVMSDAT